MKKTLLTLFILTATAFSCFAQHIDSFGLAGEAGLPTGQATSIYDYTIGFAVKLESPAKIKHLKFVASLGYTDYVLKSGLEKVIEADYLPMEVGAKYYVHSFYFEGNVGEELDLNGSIPTQRSGLVYLPTIGYTVQGLDFDEVDFGISYQGSFLSDGPLSRISLSIVYRLNL